MLVYDILLLLLFMWEKFFFSCWGITLTLKAYRYLTLIANPTLFINIANYTYIYIYTHTHTHIYIYIYNYEWRNWYIKLEITMTRKSSTHLHVTYGALNSCFDHIRSYQQCTRWFRPLEFEPTTTVWRSRNSTTGATGSWPRISDTDS